MFTMVPLTMTVIKMTMVMVLVVYDALCFPVCNDAYVKVAVNLKHLCFFL